MFRGSKAGTDIPKSFENEHIADNSNEDLQDWSVKAGIIFKNLSVAPVQKAMYKNTYDCVGKIFSWMFDSQTRYFCIKRADGVQYLKSRMKYLSSLPKCEIQVLKQLELINRSKDNLARIAQRVLREEAYSEQ